MLVGPRLKVVREQANISQYRLAKLSGISQSHISEIEAGLTEPTVGLLTRLCDALGLPLNAFFDDDCRVVEPASGYSTDGEHGLAQTVAEAIASDPELKQFWHAFVSRQDLRVALRTLASVRPQTLRQVVKIAKALEEDK